MSLAGDEAADKAYDGMLDVFMNVADKHPKNLAGLLGARKEFDQVAEAGLKGAFDEGTVTAKKQALRDIRREANNFIADQLPAGDAMRGVLHRQNLMYEAVDNMSDKIAPKIGTNAIQRVEKIIRKHPVISTTAAAAGGAAALKGVLGK